MTEINETIAPSPPNRNLRNIVVGGFLLLFISLLALGLRNSSTAQPRVGETAPELTMTFYDGYEWREQETAVLSEMRGQPVVLNFWASWCAPCREEAALLEATSRDYAAQGVLFVGVAWSDTDTDAFEYLEEFQITYPNAPDLRLRAEDSYNFRSVPETFFIDADGVIQRHFQGPLNENQIKSFIDGLLEG